MIKALCDIDEEEPIGDVNTANEILQLIQRRRIVLEDYPHLKRKIETRVKFATLMERKEEKRIAAASADVALAVQSVERDRVGFDLQAIDFQGFAVPDSEQREPYRIEGPFYNAANGKRYVEAHKVGWEMMCETTKQQYFSKEDEVSGLAELLTEDKARLMLTKWVWERNGYVVHSTEDRTS